MTILWRYGRSKFSKMAAFE